MKKFSVLVLLIILTGISCERDDICAASTPTTPHLIIRFYDINTQDQTKQVRQLSVIGEGMPEGNEIVFSTDTDSIVLPLRFQKEGVITTTSFELTRDTDFDNDTNNTTFSNTDVLQISYTPQFVYVSRACGYKSIFNDPQTTIGIDSDNWIFGSEILTTSIDNENEAHIILYH